MLARSKSVLLGVGSALVVAGVSLAGGSWDGPDCVTGDGKTCTACSNCVPNILGDYICGNVEATATCSGGTTAVCSAEDGVYSAGCVSTPVPIPPEPNPS